MRLGPGATTSGQAAALVAEAGVVSGSRNVTKRAATAAAGTYWMQRWVFSFPTQYPISHQRTPRRSRDPTVLLGKALCLGGNDPKYVVFRNVLDYGAVGDGVTNAIVYSPPGKYLIYSTIPMPFGTEVIGDANNRPTLVAAPSFVRLGVLSTDEYTGAPGPGIDGGDLEYYVNAANFYRQIRNIVIQSSKRGAGSRSGLVSILDSSFTNVGTAVVVNPVTSTPGMGSTGVALENVALSGVTVSVADTTSATLLTASSALIDEWAVGPVYEGSTSARTLSKGGRVGSYRRHSSLLDPEGAYFERAKTQYEDQAIIQFMDVKDFEATGYGSTDDTAAFQSALYASLGKILSADAGSYIQPRRKPQVLIKVGNARDIGSVEMQDLLFTTRGATAGLILVEWNIQIDNPGSAALWDCHARVGGATGTKLTIAECPPVVLIKDVLLLA
ncbi:hypothetical protein BGZ57DRAFT_930940 [Hyaloscypha finlandica]|nr:hypothetical protein BGZ57DRAFT_930940 [Hyaloscypha finlandica]